MGEDSARRNSTGTNITDSGTGDFASSTRVSGGLIRGGRIVMLTARAIGFIGTPSRPEVRIGGTGIMVASTMPTEAIH
jgi:hypothetical protein